jgi:hypothetical protein
VVLVVLELPWLAYWKTLLTTERMFEILADESVVGAELLVTPAVAFEQRFWIKLVTELILWSLMVVGF